MSMSGTLRSLLVTAASAALFVGVSAVPAAADGVIDPAPIGPNTFFVGEVNNTAGPAVIQMACFGPVTPGETGHPLAGQTVKALPASTPVANTAGYTGSAADEILVSFNLASATTPIVLHYWAVSAAIPTTLVLPCGGTGTVTFTPYPGSTTSRPATVTVSFVGQP
jgi:hypothetical protein